MSNDYATAWDSLAEVIGAAQGRSSGSISDIGHMTIDQQLKVVEVAALLSIAQEISSFNPNNTMTRGADGVMRNAWGKPVENWEV